MSYDDSEADFLLHQANIPSGSAERYRQEANRLLRVMPFSDALRRIDAMYRKETPSVAGFPRKPY